MSHFVSCCHLLVYICTCKVGAVHYTGLPTAVILDYFRMYANYAYSPWTSLLSIIVQSNLPYLGSMGPWGAHKSEMSVTYVVIKTLISIMSRLRHNISNIAHHAMPKRSATNRCDFPCIIWSVISGFFLGTWHYAATSKPSSAPGREIAQKYYLRMHMCTHVEPAR